VIDRLKGVGTNINKDDDSLHIEFQNIFRPMNVTTLPYPGFPTDMQAQIMALMCITPGISIITEKIFPDRFTHVAELNRMGARIHREGQHAIVEGVKELSGAPLTASDLRASACLVLAGLTARGRTEISRTYHLERGYENLVDKLRLLHANVWLEKDE
jgi:UDP-N-acetylglucosamine 1-carboxyvinyltransferase